MRCSNFIALLSCVCCAVGAIGPAGAEFEAPGTPENVPELLVAADGQAVSDVTGGIASEMLRIRDPFVLPCPDEGVYRLYHARPFSGGEGVDVRMSKDLRTWSAPRPALRLPENLRNTVSAYWAPEVHAYGGKHYLFVTLVREKMRDRLGTWVFVGDSPDGPFRVIADHPVTPIEWQCLDGTFWVEDGRPYMVFCHGWTQCDNGRMMFAPLKSDFSGLDAEPTELFKATDYTSKEISPFKKGVPLDRVTDGPFLHRMASGRLLMIWSNLISGDASHPKGRYVEIQCESTSGRIAGPWKKHKLLIENDGGHGMIFQKLGGGLALAFHQPNGGPDERMRFSDVDEGEAGLSLRSDGMQNSRMHK